MKVILNSLEDTKKFTTDLMSKISKGNEATVIGLYGNLGAGKTHITKYIAEYLGVEESVVSPTFVIMKFYKINKNSNFRNLIHIDAYRIQSSEELLRLGFSEYLKDNQNLIVIEWPENIKEILKNHHKIIINHGQNDTERQVEVSFE